MWTSFMFLYFVIQIIHNSISGPLHNKYQKYSELHSVQIFREYLRIDTSNEENLKCAVNFWAREFRELGIPFAVYKPARKPIIVATIRGSDPTAPSIMLNSHMDVVKADPSLWTYPPFDAYMDVNGDIYARGTQDTKDTSIQILEAIRKLKQENVTLLRTLHMTLMPDEEVGGKDGMKAFIETQEFKSLNVGFMLDEGITSTDDFLFGLYQDRRAWQMQFVIHGEGGHGFSMPDNTAMDKTRRFINAVMSYRDSQKRIMKTRNYTDYTGFNSLNINIINGGIQTNVIALKTKFIIDMRLSPDANITEVDAIVNSWVETAGNGTELTYLRKELESRMTPVDDSNPYWVTIKTTLKKIGIDIKPVVSPAISDSLFVRRQGIPVIGFSTNRRTNSRVHNYDEYLNVEIFVKGIKIFGEVIKSLANLPCN